MEQIENKVGIKGWIALFVLCAPAFDSNFVFFLFLYCWCCLFKI